MKEEENKTNRNNRQASQTPFLLSATEIVISRVGRSGSSASDPMSFG